MKLVIEVGRGGAWRLRGWGRLGLTRVRVNELIVAFTEQPALQPFL